MLAERCILHADGFRLTSQDVVGKQVTIKTGGCCDAVQLMPKGSENLYSLIRQEPCMYWELTD